MTKMADGSTAAAAKAATTVAAATTEAAAAEATTKATGLEAAARVIVSEARGEGGGGSEGERGRWAQKRGAVPQLTRFTSHALVNIQKRFALPTEW